MFVVTALSLKKCALIIHSHPLPAFSGSIAKNRSNASAINGSFRSEISNRRPLERNEMPPPGGPAITKYDSLKGRIPWLHEPGESNRVTPVGTTVRFSTINLPNSPKFCCTWIWAHP